MPATTTDNHNRISVEFLGMAHHPGPGSKSIAKALLDKRRRSKSRSLVFNLGRQHIFLVEDICLSPLLRFIHTRWCSVHILAEASGTRAAFSRKFLLALLSNFTNTTTKIAATWSRPGSKIGLPPCIQLSLRKSSLTKFMSCGHDLPFRSLPLFGKDSLSKIVYVFMYIKVFHSKAPKWPLAKRCSLLRSNSSPKPGIKKENNMTIVTIMTIGHPFLIFPLPLSLEPISSSDLALVWLSTSIQDPNIDPLWSSNLHPAQDFSSRFHAVSQHPLNPFHSARLRLAERSMYQENSLPASNFWNLQKKLSLYLHFCINV